MPPYNYVYLQKGLLCKCSSGSDPRQPRSLDLDREVHSLDRSSRSDSFPTD